MKYKSTTHYILSGLVPYTEANFQLAFHPHAFFNELERIGKYKSNAAALRTSYYRAVKQGLISIEDTSPMLTDKGKQKLARSEPSILSGQARLIVVFDIPESERHLRSRLRATLREFHFHPIQQSVWESEYDVKQYVLEAIRAEGIERYVKLYESALLN